MSEQNPSGPVDRDVGPVAWYVQRVAPGYRDDGTRLGPSGNARRRKRGPTRIT